MSELEVALDSIRAAFQGVIPSSIATASAKGIPNSTFLSVIWYIDDERIALSNQFLGKTASNLRENPLVALRVIEPTTMLEYELEATYLRSDTAGEVFENVRAQLEAVASQSGAENIFHLRGIEILRVDQCAPAGKSKTPSGPTSEAAELLSGLGIFLRRLSECRDLAEATRVGLQSIDDLFGFRHSILLLADSTEQRLFAVATNGYARSGVGAEVASSDGAIGVAAHRRRQVHLANVERLRLGGAANAGASEGTSEIPLPGLDDAQSMLATPLLLHDRLIGVLYLDSSRPGYFDAQASQLVEVLAGHLAVTIALLESGGLEPLVENQAVTVATSEVASVTVAFHDHDGTVLVDGDYVIKGVPGRILFSLLSEHDNSGRTEFTNREIRLDPSIELPAGNDNLEARLLTLRRRLAYRRDPFRLERIGRGRLQLSVDRPLTLVRHDHHLD